MKKYVCEVCGYVYDEAKGDPDNGVKPGTKFEDLPADWVCPMCGVEDKDINHVLRTCSRARQVWAKLVPQNLWRSFFNGSNRDWLQANLKSNSNWWTILFATTCWILWKR